MSFPCVITTHHTRDSAWASLDIDGPHYFSGCSVYIIDSDARTNLDEVRARHPSTMGQYHKGVIWVCDFGFKYQRLKLTVPLPDAVRPRYLCVASCVKHCPFSVLLPPSTPFRMPRILSEVLCALMDHCSTPVLDKLMLHLQSLNRDDELTDPELCQALLAAGAQVEKMVCSVP